MSLAWEVETLEAEVEDLRERVECFSPDDGQAADAIKAWRYVHPVIRRRVVQNIECGDPVEAHSHERARAREALIALLEALE